MPAANVVARKDETTQWLPVLAGGSLIAYGLGTRSKKGAAVAIVGGGIIWAGTRRLARSSVGAAFKGFEVHKSVTVNAPPEALYQYWRRLENLPSVMQHLESVEQIDNRRSHWVAKAPAGYCIEWEAEIVDDEPHVKIAWRSLLGADLDITGSVEFRPGPRGTQVKVYLRYEPPAGIIGKAVAMLFGEDPSIQVEQDLRRFKQLMETGEVITTEGQPSGRR
jgi:uncharacterized membrane protein